MAKIKKEHEFPLYIFHAGKNYKSYEFFGCHRIKGNTFAEIIQVVFSYFVTKYFVKICISVQNVAK